MRLFEVAVNKIKTHLEYHDTLNPKLWDISVEPAELKNDVKMALDDIVDDILEEMSIERKDINDIVLTGSNCNFNWSKLSDIDLHIELDYSKVCPDCSEDELQSCFDAKKTNWNDNHNITIKGFDVEVYIQPEGRTTATNAGIYSLYNDEWIKEPTRDEDLEYDEKSIKTKSKKFMDRIDELEKDGPKKLDAAISLKDKIKKMRQAAILKGGEFSLENLVFKTLRNNGYMDKLYTYIEKSKDENLSLS